MIWSHDLHQKCDRLKDMVKDNQILVASFVDDISCTFLHSSEGPKDKPGRGPFLDVHIRSKDPWFQ